MRQPVATLRSLYRVPAEPRACPPVARLWPPPPPLPVHPTRYAAGRPTAPRSPVHPTRYAAGRPTPPPQAPALCRSHGDVHLPPPPPHLPALLAWPVFTHPVSPFPFPQFRIKRRTSEELPQPLVLSASLLTPSAHFGSGEYNRRSTAAPAISLFDDFLKADATGHYASPGWSDLPNDLLIHILNLLELPEALAFRAVCPSWRSASTAAASSVPPRRTPWLVSLTEEPLPGRKKSRELWDPTVSSKFCNLLDKKTFQVSFSWGQAVALCGASHGWLIMANKLSNLVLYDPFTATLIHLPAITRFDSCIEGVYGDDEGKNLLGYRYGCYKCTRVYDLHILGGHFYDKVVLSGSPSAGCTFAMAIYLDGKRLSFTKVGNACWQQVSTIRSRNDSFADCIYHRGRLYAVTMRGRLKCVDFGGPGEPWMETFITEDGDDFGDVITRYLVSTPWGRLLQLRVILDKQQVNNLRVEIDRFDMKSQKMVGLSSAKALRGHAAFVGQNNPGILSTKEFPELKPDCIYFTTPRLRQHNVFDKRDNEWNGVKVYDLKKRTLEAVFPSGGGDYGTWCPLEVWFTPSL